MPSYTISLLRHDGSSQMFELSQQRVVIGRETGDIVTGDPQVSNDHAEITFVNGTLTFKDLSSTNGSYRVNGERVTSVTLTPGTALKLGGSTIAVQDIQATGMRGGTQVMPQASGPVGEAAPAAAPRGGAAGSGAASGGSASGGGRAGEVPARASGATSGSAAPVDAVASGATPGEAPGAAWSGDSASGAMPGPEASGGATPGRAPGAWSGDSAGAGHSAGRDFGAQIQRAVEAGPSSEGLIDQFKFYLATAASIYKNHWQNGALTMGLVAVPAALITAAFGWIPLLGLIVSLLVGLVQLALTPIAAGAMGRWALAAAAGRSLTWKQAWGAALKSPVSEWLNLAVASFVIAIGTMLLVVPGIIVGMFALPAYLLEKQRFVGINSRSANLVMKNPARHLGLALLAVLTMVPLFIASAIIGVILSFVPVVGPPLASLLNVAISVLALPFVYLIWSEVYYDSRQKIEGQDARAGAAAEIERWSAG